MRYYFAIFPVEVIKSETFLWEGLLAWDGREGVGYGLLVVRLA